MSTDWSEEMQKAVEVDRKNKISFLDLSSRFLPEEYKKIIDQINCVCTQEIDAIAKAYDIPEDWASKILYLRLLVIWNKERENALIKAAKNGAPSSSWEDLLS